MFILPRIDYTHRLCRGVCLVKNTGEKSTSIRILYSMYYGGMRENTEGENPKQTFRGDSTECYNFQDDKIEKN